MIPIDMDFCFTTLKFFDYEHLPDKLKPVSKPFKDLALVVAKSVYDKYVSTGASEGLYNPLELSRAKEEADVALRKLLEAKDAAVRAALCIT
jgi:hypothetical protein